jgi:hypothetical protein
MHTTILEADEEIRSKTSESSETLSICEAVKKLSRGELFLVARNCIRAGLLINHAMVVTKCIRCCHAIHDAQTNPKVETELHMLTDAQKEEIIVSVFTKYPQLGK